MSVATAAHDIFGITLGEASESPHRAAVPHKLLDNRVVSLSVKEIDVALLVYQVDLVFILDGAHDLAEELLVAALGELGAESGSSLATSDVVLSHITITCGQHQVVGVKEMQVVIIDRDLKVQFIVGEVSRHPLGLITLNRDIPQGH